MPRHGRRRQQARAAASHATQRPATRPGAYRQRRLCAQLTQHEQYRVLATRADAQRFLTFAMAALCEAKCVQEMFVCTYSDSPALIIEPPASAYVREPVAANDDIAAPAPSDDGASDDVPVFTPLAARLGGGAPPVLSSVVDAGNALAVSLRGVAAQLVSTYLLRPRSPSSSFFFSFCFFLQGCTLLLSAWSVARWRCKLRQRVWPNTCFVCRCSCATRA